MSLGPNDPKYTTGHGIEDLTTEGHKLLKGCIHAHPDGCRSADNECGPPPTYPCFIICGLDWKDWKTYFSDERDRMMAV